MNIFDDSDFEYIKKTKILRIWNLEYYPKASTCIVHSDYKKYNSYPIT